MKKTWCIIHSFIHSFSFPIKVKAIENNKTPSHIFPSSNWECRVLPYLAVYLKYLQGETNSGHCFFLFSSFKKLLSKAPFFSSQMLSSVFVFCSFSSFHNCAGKWTFSVVFFYYFSGNDKRVLSCKALSRTSFLHTVTG